MFIYFYISSLIAKNLHLLFPTLVRTLPSRSGKTNASPDSVAGRGAACACPERVMGGNCGHRSCRAPGEQLKRLGGQPGDRGPLSSRRRRPLPSPLPPSAAAAAAAAADSLTESVPGQGTAEEEPNLGGSRRRHVAAAEGSAFLPGPGACGSHRDETVVRRREESELPHGDATREVRRQTGTELTNVRSRLRSRPRTLQRSGS